MKLYEIVINKDMTTVINDFGNQLLVPSCGQTIKATAAYLLIGCPEINERAGRIYVYLRKIFVNAY